MKDKKTREEYDREVGARVRYFRSLKCVSQEDLGRRLGLSVQQVQKYEKGTNRLSAGTVIAIADKLGIPFHWLMTDDQGAIERPLLDPELIDIQVGKLVRAYQAIEDREDRKALVVVAQAMGKAA